MAAAAGLTADVCLASPSAPVAPISAVMPGLVPLLSGSILVDVVHGVDSSAF
jgi:hypothetical protein